MRARDVYACMMISQHLYFIIIGADAADNAEHVTAIIFDCIASHVRAAGVVFTEHFVYLRTKLRCLHGAYDLSPTLFLLSDCILDLFVQPCSV
jgi:hypothetical protein